MIAGDFAQQDLKRHSGLQLLLDVAEYAGMNIPIINFDSWDYCVRSEEAKAWVWSSRNMKTVSRSFMNDTAR